MSDTKKEDKTEQNAEIVYHLHEIYWCICNKSEVTISNQGMKRNIGMQTFSSFIEGQKIEIALVMFLKNVHSQ